MAWLTWWHTVSKLSILEQQLQVKSSFLVFFTLNYISSRLLPHNSISSCICLSFINCFSGKPFSRGDWLFLNMKCLINQANISSVALIYLNICSQIWICEWQLEFVVHIHHGRCCCRCHWCWQGHSNV